MATILSEPETASASPFSMRPLAKGFAVQVDGLDLSKRVDPDTAAGLRQALADHKVLVFRNQDLDSDALIAVAEQFGRIFPGKRKSAVPLKDLLARLEGNVGKDGKPNGRLYDSWGLRWHSDVSWSDHPGVATMLHSIMLPDAGGHTEFADMQASFDALTPDQQAELERMSATHNFWCVRAFRHGMILPWARHPAGGLHNISLKEHLFQWLRVVVHSLTFKAPKHRAVMVHPVTGRKSVYLGHHAWRILGLPWPKGISLVNRLNRRTMASTEVYRHEWKVGDLVIWDNQSLLHRLMPFDTRNQPRQMRRLVVILDKKGVLTT